MKKSKTSTSVSKPMSANTNNGTLKGPKQNNVNVSNGTKATPSGLRPKEKMACLDKGGKSCID